MLVVGLCGYAGAGKSTAADHLVNNHCFKRHGFADPIRNIGRTMGLSEDYITGKLKETPCEHLGGKSWRFFAQRLGTEFGREMIHPDLWVKIWLATIPQGVPGVVADDVRFANERLAIRRLGGLVVEVARPGKESGNHPSEVIDFQTDRILINDKTIRELQDQIDAVLNLGMVGGAYA